MGRTIPALGGSQNKAGVILAASADGRLPKFSKMSGIQEWANGVMLFVNISTDGGEMGVYENVFKLFGRGSDGSLHDNFLREGAVQDNVLCLTWFAQPRQTEESPVIRRLIAAPRARDNSKTPLASTSAISPPTTVLLFCRQGGVGEYIYCGRLGYEGHVSGSRPLRFRLSLQDWCASGRGPPGSAAAPINPKFRPSSPSNLMRDSILRDLRESKEFLDLAGLTNY